jgi:hypothetical protein
MLPTIMSQMGMSTDSGLAGELGRRKFPGRSDQPQAEGGNDQAGAEADDEEVPGRLRRINFSSFIYLSNRSCGKF